MGIIMFIIFLMMDISLVGIFAFVYSGKEQYSEGMILGVHIPQGEIKHEEVQNLGQKYKKSLKKFNLWNLFIGTLVCFLCFWNFTAFIIIWMIWLFAYIGVGTGLINVTHRKMYDIKMKHNWIMEGNTHVVHIDTVLSSMSEKLPISHWWNLPVVIGIGISLFLPPIKEYSGVQAGWILPVLVLIITLFLWGFQLWLRHRQNNVYSGDSSVNISLNRLEKRSWSVLLLSANYLNLLSWCYLVIRIISNKWLYAIDYWIYIVMQMIPTFVIILGIVYIRKKRTEILSMDSNPLIVDDDEYWKNGWYNNPNDNHLWVPDRMCSTNYSMNLAKPASKVIAAVTAVSVIVITIGVAILVLCLDNTKITVHMDGSQVTIDTTLYDTHFKESEIQSVKILDKMPEDDFTRTNGGATEKILVGYFEGKETGKCMMYLYQDYVPILEIKLKDKVIFMNSKKEEEVQEWYEELKK